MGIFCKLFGLGWDCNYEPSVVYIENGVVDQEAEILQLRERLDRERRMAVERERRRYSSDSWYFPTINVRLGSRLNHRIHHNRRRH